MENVTKHGNPVLPQTSTFEKLGIILEMTVLISIFDKCSLLYIYDR